MHFAVVTLETYILACAHIDIASHIMCRSDASSTAAAYVLTSDSVDPKTCLAADTHVLRAVCGWVQRRGG